MTLHIPHHPHPVQHFVITHPAAPEWALLGLVTLATLLLWAASQ